MCHQQIDTLKRTSNTIIYSKNVSENVLTTDDIFITDKRNIFKLSTYL